MLVPNKNRCEFSSKNYRKYQIGENSVVQYTNILIIVLLGILRFNIDHSLQIINIPNYKLTPF